MHLMPQNIKLLGVPSINLAGNWQPIPSDKRGAFLIYLAYKQDWLHREQLSFLFWPDSDDKTARRNLRQIINRSKKLAFAETIELDDQRLRWQVNLDTTSFKEAIAKQNWAEATKLYQADFCEDLKLTDSNAFQDWLALERQAYASAFAEAARKHAAELLASKAYLEAARLLKRVLMQDDLAEDVLQRYLEAAYLAGQKEEALQFYEQFTQRLKTELDLEPLQETQEIIAVIKQSETLSVSAQKPKSKQLVPLSVMRPPALVGRQALIEEIQMSHAQLIILKGEAGVGKTRLMAELAPNAVLIKAQEGLANIPFNPIVSFIKEREVKPLKALGAYQDDLLRLIPELEPNLRPGPADPITAKQRLLEALARYLELSASKTGVALAFDDIQWLDASSLELLVFLQHRGTLKIMATCRKFELSEQLAKTLKSLPFAQMISVEPLAKTAIETLLSKLMNSEAKPALFANWLHTNTGGNIMFVLETLKSLFEAGDLKADQQGWHSNLDAITQDYSELVIPKAVSEIIQRRLEPLNEEVKRVLQGAAVMGKDLSPKVLAQITGLSQWSVIEAFEECQHTGVINDNQFSHDLLRQSIYTNLSSHKKVLLHARIAQTLHPESNELLLAEHWLAAQEPDKAATAILSAARNQRSIGLQAEALTNLERSLTFDLEKPLKLEIKRLISFLLIELGQLQKATSALAELLNETQDPNLRASILCSQQGLFMSQGQTDKAEKTRQELAALIKAHDFSNELKRDMLSNDAVYFYHQANYEKSIALQLECNELCRSLNDQLRLALGLSSLGAIYDYAGYFEEALTAYNEAIKISRDLNAPHMEQEVSLNLISYFVDQAKHGEAIKIGESALALGRYDTTDYVRNNLAAAYLEIAQHKEAIKQFESVVAESENITLQCNAWARLAYLYAKEKQADKLEQALKQALELVQKTDSPVAHSRVIVSCLLQTEAKYKKAAQDLLARLDMNSVPSVARVELEQVLADYLT